MVVRRMLYGPQEVNTAQTTAQGILRGAPSDEDWGGTVVKVFVKRLFRRAFAKGL